MYPKLAALALGVALTIGAAAGEARAARECAVSLSIFGISIDVCAERDAVNPHGLEAVNANIAGGVVDVTSSGTCNLEAHNSQGDVEPGGANVNVSMAVCTRP
jgi:hypothetical protein